MNNTLQRKLIPFQIKYFQEERPHSNPWNPSKLMPFANTQHRSKLNYISLDFVSCEQKKGKPSYMSKMIPDHMDMGNKTLSYYQV